MKPPLSLALLLKEAGAFAQLESDHSNSAIYGVTDGKAIGTYFEHKFQSYLTEKYSYKQGSSASGIDFPSLGVDMKITRTTQPQSSCPFRSAKQKIYGLGSAILNMTCHHQDRGTTEAKTGPLQPILPRSWPKVGEKTGPFVQIQNCWVGILLAHICIRKS